MGTIFPSAKGGLVWIHGEDSNGEPVKIQATDAGILYVTFDGILATGEKLFGYDDVISEQLSDTNLAAGTNNLDGTTVPSGELWHITQVAVAYVGTVPTSMQTMGVIDSNWIRLGDERTITSGVYYPYSCSLYLNAGSFMRVRVTAATLNDDLHLAYCGTKQAV